MIDLQRTIRFCLNDSREGHDLPSRHNGFAGWPPMRGLGRYYQAHVLCSGEADPATGYFLNIKQIDAAFRDHALPWLRSFMSPATDQAVDVGVPDEGPLPMGLLMQRMLQLLQPPLNHSVQSVTLELTPFYRLQIETNDMSHLLMRQQYEFSAAHRLHSPSLSDAENRRVFGKCNNPSGHGHNYKVEVAVRVPIDPEGRTLYPEQLDELVNELCIEKLDHKNLDVDVPEFSELNTSVENIAPVIYEMLRGPIGANLCVELEEVSVWETGKTVCTYRGLNKPAHGLGAKPAISDRIGEH